MKKLFYVASSLLLLSVFATSLMAQNPTTSLIDCEPTVIDKKIQVGDKAADDNFEVWNAGIATLSYTIGNNTSAPKDDTKTYTIEYSPDVGINWVNSITPLVGSSKNAESKNTHTITYNSASLPAGTYQATVYIVNNGSYGFNPATGNKIYWDVKTVIIILKVGVPKFKCLQPKLPIIGGQEMGDYQTIENYMAYRGDGLPGSNTLAWDPVPVPFEVENIGGGEMLVEIAGIENDIPAPNYGRMIYEVVPKKQVIGSKQTGTFTVYFYDPKLGPGTSNWFPKTGSYSGWIKMTAKDNEDKTDVLPAGPEDGGDGENEFLLKVVVRVGPKAIVNTWTPPVCTGVFSKGFGGPILIPVAGYARTDQEPIDAFVVTYDANNIDNRRSKQGLFPPAVVVADPEQNSNHLHYTISRGGDINGNWIKAEISGLGKQENTLSELGDTDIVLVNYNTSNLPVYPPESADQPGIKNYKGYIYVRTNDYFGNEGANYAEDENDINTEDPDNGYPHPAIDPPTYYPDQMWISTVVPIYLTVRGPTIATSNNSFSQTIVQGNNANTQTFQIWNLYGVSTLHYSVNVEGAVLPDGTKWMMVSDSDPNQDSKDETDKNTVTLTYNASGLKTGTYTAKITYTDKNATNSPYYVNVTLRVLGPIVATDKVNLNPVCVIGENATNDTQFYVWNADEKDNPPGYQGSTLQYSILSSVDSGPMWFTCDPVKGDSTGQADKDLIKVTYLTSALEAGTHHGTIAIYNINDGSSKTIDVNLLVRAPMIAVSQLTFHQKCDIGTDAGSQSFQIWNSGDTNTVLEYSLSTDVQWLTLTDSNPNHISTGDTDRNTITLKYSTSSLSAGIYNAKIRISSTKAPNSPVEIPVTLEVQAPQIALSKTVLYPTCLEGFDAAPTTFEVWNSGFSTLNYSISSSVDWIACNPISGDSKGVNDKDTINVTYKTSDKEPGSYTGTITVSDPQASNNPQEIQVTLTVQKPVLTTDKVKIDAVAALGQNAPPQAFEIWNEGNGNINWSLVEDPAVDWLAADPTSGNSTGEHDQVALTFTSDALPAGIYETDLVITGKDDKDREVPGSPAVVHVTLSVGPRIGINLDPAELNPECNEGENAPAQTFTVKNIGVGTLNYTITDNVAWLSCNPTSGQSTGENDQITVTYETSALPSGSYKGKISIKNTDTNDITVIDVNLKVKSGAVISLSTNALNPVCGQGADAPQDKFIVKNSGTGTLNYTINAGAYDPSDKGNWISNIFPSSGSSAGEEDEITVTYSTAALPLGVYTAIITVSDPAADNSPQEILVTLTVLGPTIAFEPKQISASCPAGEDAPSTSFEVWNLGGGILDYTISKDVDWFACAPTQGSSSGEHDTITVTFSTASLSSGTHNGNITISADGATNSPQVIPVTVSVGQPTIALSTNILAPYATEGENPDPQTFQVWNSGFGTLDFTIADDADWLSCEPNSGASTGISDKKTITVSYDTASMEVGAYNAEITITDAKATNSPQKIAVALIITKEIPSENLVLHLSAGLSTITKDISSKVSFWSDLSDKRNDASQYKSSLQAKYVEKGINDQPTIAFDKSVMSLQNSPINEINNSKIGSFSEKTIAVVFKTGGDITTKQTILAQGSKDRGINIYISNKKLYMGAWNIKNEGPSSGWSPKFVSTQLLPNTIYLAEFVMDQPNNLITGYLNGNLIGTATNIGKLYNDPTPLAIGSALGNVQSSPEDANQSKAKNLIGLIPEVVYYNSVLNEEKRKALEFNLIGKYGITEPQIVARGLALWLRSDAEVYFDEATNVKKWGDISSISKKSPLLKSSSKKQPKYVVPDGKLPYLKYEGYSVLQATSHVELNSDKSSYPQRTIFIVFETGTDVSSDQILWTEGDKKAGMNIFIQNGGIYMGAWGAKAPAGESSWDPVFISKMGLAENARYCAQLIFDQKTNKFTGYLNGLPLSTETNIGKLFKHSPGSMGAANFESNINGSLVKKGAYLNGDVYEMVIYNSVLTEDENTAMKKYISDRYGVIFP